MASKLHKTKRKESLAQRRNSEQSLVIREEIRKALSDPKVAQTVISVATQQTEVFQGPFPHPEHCVRYEQMMPGFMERTMTLTENAQKADISTIIRRDWAEILSRIFGIFVGGLVCIGFGGAGAWLIYADKPIAGYAALVTGMGSIVGIFVLRKK